MLEDIVWLLLLLLLLLLFLLLLLLLLLLIQSNVGFTEVAPTVQEGRGEKHVHTKQIKTNIYERNPQVGRQR